mmetsp:Transcript_30590/g.46938  ORF Transcript_30590/g.46938 Transcript_30590/m.46938 type:complete len:109 (-) Transcript_30590:141-467(-)|eukprot:CAMPEP_0195304116 /NCGR_PEP_ID=MMETSP0707-20130614/33889_1 /TAXON_ID=33640 /ORGANISM="Asterionellopsis glacialis, Strain CCMP134" /LENGTH=108 /DNA_ID=CAMNT_0040367833 /DNA_START=67 /DNA_END=393 /DNA_ORIENTATION=-
MSRRKQTSPRMSKARVVLRETNNDTLFDSICSDWSFHTPLQEATKDGEEAKGVNSLLSINNINRRSIFRSLGKERNLPQEMEDIMALKRENAFDSQDIEIKENLQNVK